MRFLISFLFSLSLIFLLINQGCLAVDSPSSSANTQNKAANPDPFYLHFPSFDHPSDFFDSLASDMRSLRSSIAHQMAAIDQQVRLQKQEIERHLQKVWGEVRIHNPLEQFQAIHQNKERPSISGDSSIPSHITPKTESGSLLVPSLARSKVDLIEKNDRYLINAELAGIPKDKISIHSHNGIITIEGKNEQQKEEGGEQDKYHYRERSYASIKRSFRIPSDVDPSAINARYENGLLTVDLPKNKEALKAPTQIQIQ